MPREKRAPHASLRAAGLIDQAESFATALRLMAFGLSELVRPEYGRAVAANASEISKRLDALKALLRTK